MAAQTAMSAEELENWKAGMFRLVDHEINRSEVAMKRNQIAGVRWLAMEIKRLEKRAINKYPDDTRHIRSAVSEFLSNNLIQSGGVVRSKSRVGRASSYSIDVAEMVLWAFARARGDGMKLKAIGSTLGRSGYLANYWKRNSGLPLSDYPFPYLSNSKEEDPNKIQKLKDQLWQTVYRKSGFTPDRVAKSDSEKKVKAEYLKILGTTRIPPLGSECSKELEDEQRKMAVAVRKLFEKHRKAIQR